MTLRRRDLIKTIAAAGVGALGSVMPDRAHAQTRRDHANPVQPLALKDYEPKSMLHVPETHVPRSRFPNIDFHTHLSWINRKGQTDVVRHNATIEETLRVMDAKNIRIMVNLTGGYGAALEETVRHWHQPHPDRFIVFTEPWYAKIKEANYSRFQAEQLPIHMCGCRAGIRPLLYQV